MAVCSRCCRCEDGSLFLPVPNSFLICPFARAPSIDHDNASLPGLALRQQHPHKMMSTTWTNSELRHLLQRPVCPRRVHLPMTSLPRARWANAQCVLLPSRAVSGKTAPTRKIHSLSMRSHRVVGPTSTNPAPPHRQAGAAL